MPNILILYHSSSGNVKAMAQLVARGARSRKEAKVRLLSVTQAKPKDLAWCDGVAVGSPTYCGIVSWQMKRWWDRATSHWGKVGGKIGCAFSSSGGWGGGNEIACQSILSILINYGFLVFGLPDYSGPEFTMHYGAVCAGRPRTEAEKKACVVLGERLARWAAHGRSSIGPCGTR